MNSAPLKYPKRTHGQAQLHTVSARAAISDFQWLSLAQKIAEIHGSRLDFTSDGSSGTTVTIVLTPSVQDTDL